MGFTSAYLIFIAKAMPLAPITVISLLVDLGACAVLFRLKRASTCGGRKSRDVQFPPHVAGTPDRRRRHYSLPGMLWVG